MVQMRVVYGLAIIMSATSMSGCVSNTFTSLSNLSTGCVTGATSVTCTAPTLTSTGTGATVPTTTTTTGTTTTTTPTVNTGNTSTLVDGDTTIILEGSTVKSLVGAKPGVSVLTDSPLNHLYANNTTLAPADLAALLTADQKIQFNTNTANNANWPVAKTMTFSDYGTCINDGGMFAGRGAIAAGPTNPAVPAAPPAPGQCTTYLRNALGAIVRDKNGDPITMPGTGGHGLNADYKLYRYYQRGGFDEELQIWTWNQSYATQYRDVTASGTDPQHQAWSFGGNYTPAASVPTLGKVDYFGKFGATAKTSNFLDSDYTVTAVINGAQQTFGQTMSYNNDWRVNGDSALEADFGTGKFTGFLTPTNWQGITKTKGSFIVNVPNAESNNTACQNQDLACDPSTPSGRAVFDNWINWHSQIMSAEIFLKGDITKDLKNTTKPNQIVGTASEDLSYGWITSSGTNPLYGGFFGPNANEVTGTFALEATNPTPNGGVRPINNDQRAYIQMSGIFNGQ